MILDPRFSDIRTMEAHATGVIGDVGLADSIGTGRRYVLYDLSVNILGGANVQDYGALLLYYTPHLPAGTAVLALMVAGTTGVAHVTPINKVLGRGERPYVYASGQAVGSQVDVYCSYAIIDEEWLYQPPSYGEAETQEVQIREPCDPFAWLFGKR